MAQLGYKQSAADWGSNQKQAEGTWQPPASRIVGGEAAWRHRLEKNREEVDAQSTEIEAADSQERWSTPSRRWSSGHNDGPSGYAADSTAGLSHEDGGSNEEWGNSSWERSAEEGADRSTRTYFEGNGGSSSSSKAWRHRKGSYSHDYSNNSYSNNSSWKNRGWQDTSTDGPTSVHADEDSHWKSEKEQARASDVSSSGNSNWDSHSQDWSYACKAWGSANKEQKGDGVASSYDDERSQSSCHGYRKRRESSWHDGSDHASTPSSTHKRRRTGDWSYGEQQWDTPPKETGEGLVVEEDANGRASGSHQHQGQGGTLMSERERSDRLRRRCVEARSQATKQAVIRQWDGTPQSRGLACQRVRFHVLYWESGKFCGIKFGKQNFRLNDLQRHEGATICGNCDGIVNSWKSRVENVQSSLRVCFDSAESSQRQDVQDFTCLSPQLCLNFQLRSFGDHIAAQNHNSSLGEAAILGAAIHAAREQSDPEETGVYATHFPKVSQEQAQTAQARHMEWLRSYIQEIRQLAEHSGGVSLGLMLDLDGMELSSHGVAGSFFPAGQRPPITDVVILLGGPSGIEDTVMPHIVEAFSELHLDICKVRFPGGKHHSYVALNEILTFHDRGFLVPIFEDYRTLGPEKYQIWQQTMKAALKHLASSSASAETKLRAVEALAKAAVKKRKEAPSQSWETPAQSWSEPPQKRFRSSQSDNYNGTTQGQPGRWSPDKATGSSTTNEGHWKSDYHSGWKWSKQQNSCRA